MHRSQRERENERNKGKMVLRVAQRGNGGD
jgi:hypothetical protein